MAATKKLMGVGIAAQPAIQIVGDTGVNLVALGSTQATALLIGNDNNWFGTVAATTGATLPASAGPGDALFTYNGGANALTVYPPLGGTMNALAVNTGIAVTMLKSATFVCRDGLNWASILSA